MSTDGEFDLDEQAQMPKKTVGDEGSVEEHDLEDQIKYDTYKRGAAANRPPYGMRMARMIPNGTVSPGSNGPIHR